MRVSNPNPLATVTVEDTGLTEEQHLNQETEEINEEEEEEELLHRREKKSSFSVGDGGSQHRKSVLWRVFGQTLPRSEIVYLCQMLLIFSVVAVSLYNLTSGAGDGKLWTALLSSCLGYVLPNPSISPNSGSGKIK